MKLCMDVLKSNIRSKSVELVKFMRKEKVTFCNCEIMDYETLSVG